MNNKAQVLVIFVILLPLLLLFLAYTVDITYLNYHKNKLDNINILIVNEVIDNPNISIEDIGVLVRKNDKDIIIKDITKDNNIKIELEEEIPTIFGRLIGKNKYIVSSKIQKDINN